MGAGCYTFSTNNLSPGQLVFVSVKAKGAYPVVNVAWRRLGIWDWKSDCYFLATPSETDGRGWKTLEGCFSVPERADGVGLIMGGVATAASPINFDDINIYVYPLFEK